jgi:hypothetical protein
LSGKTRGLRVGVRPGTSMGKAWRTRGLPVSFTNEDEMGLNALGGGSEFSTGEIILS